MGGGDGPTTMRAPEILKQIPASGDAGVAVASALIASGTATPFILTIDKAVVQAAAGTTSLSQALAQNTKDLFLRLPQLVKSPALWLVWGVYGATYTAANLIDVVSERKQVAASTHSSAKLVGTTGINMGSSLVKDILFAKMFGKQDVAKEAAEAAKTVAKRSVPPATYGIFLMRDTLTIGAGFTLPPLVASGLKSTAGMESKAADKTAQIITPMGMQLVCTPMHLLALNMYNTPNAPWAQRAQEVWATCPQSTVVRMLRFCCAYGFGGLLNKELTARGKAYNEQKYLSAIKVNEKQVDTKKDGSENLLGQLQGQRA